MRPVDPGPATGVAAALHALCAQVVAHPWCDRVSGYLREPGRDAYRPLASIGARGPDLRARLASLPYPGAATDHLFAAALASAGPVYAAPGMAGAGVPGAGPGAVWPGACAAGAPPAGAMAVALRQGGQPIAVVAAARFADPTPPPADLQQHLASAAAATTPRLAAELARTRAVRDRDALAALTRVTTRVSAAEGLGPTLDLAAELARRLLGGRECRVELLEPDRPYRRLVAVSGSSRVTPGRVRPAADGLGGHLLAANAPVTVFHRSLGSCAPGSPELAGYLAGLGHDCQSIVAAPLRDPGGAATGLIAVMHPAPERFTLDDTRLLAQLADHLSLALANRRLLARLRAKAAEAGQQARLFSAVTGALTDLVCLLDHQGRLVWASPSVARTTGRAGAELLGQPAAKLVDPRDRARAEEARRAVAAGAPQATVELRIPGADGHTAWVETILLPGPTAPGWTVASSRVITDRKQLEGLLVSQAYCDRLTGLPNRAWLEERLAPPARARAGSGPAACLFLDLDRFKNVNDTLGHHRGDELLVEVGARLRAAASGAGTVARIGGDEFVVLVEGVAQGAAVVALAERLLSSLASPFHLAGTTVSISASLGIAAGDGDAQELLRDADAAMYRSKAAGPGRWALADPAWHAENLARFTLENELRDALAGTGMTTFFQPVVALPSQRLAGLEALVRWHHPRRGLLAPGAFLPVVEEAGLGPALGAIVLAQALAALARWRRAGGDVDVNVAVNVSARELASPELVGQVSRALGDSGVPAHRVVVEITESSVWQDEPLAVRNLHLLRELGCTLALDDFGTGFSSLSHLARLPVQILKVDKSFVDGLPGPSRGAALTAAVVRLGAELGLDVVAEGVESPAQRDALVALGCPFGQGFLFAPPEDLATATARVLRQRRPGQAPEAPAATAAVSCRPRLADTPAEPAGRPRGTALPVPR